MFQFHNNFHEIWWKNEFFIAIIDFLEKKIQNALIFIKIKILQKELHHSVRQ